MASINFLPVCSKCKSIIWKVIDYTPPCELGLLGEKLYLTKPEITPQECPVCGERFELITLPANIPFDNRHHDQEAVPVIQREIMHMFVWCCGSCGVAITDGDKFCRMCGKRLKWK